MDTQPQSPHTMHSSSVPLTSAPTRKAPHKRSPMKSPSKDLIHEPIEGLERGSEMGLSWFFPTAGSKRSKSGASFQSSGSGSLPTIGGSSAKTSHASPLKGSRKAQYMAASPDLATSPNKAHFDPSSPSFMSKKSSIPFSSATTIGLSLLDKESGNGRVPEADSQRITHAFDEAMKSLFQDQDVFVDDGSDPVEAAQKAISRLMRLSESIMQALQGMPPLAAAVGHFLKETQTVVGRLYTLATCGPTSTVLDTTKQMINDLNHHKKNHLHFEAEHAALEVKNHALANEVQTLKQTNMVLEKQIKKFMSSMPQGLEDVVIRPKTATPSVAPMGHCAMVVMDIQAPSFLWDNHTKDMVNAMALYDGLIASCAAEYNGYRAREDGEANFVAFPNIQKAMAFCVDVQLKALSLPWPEKMLVHRTTSPVLAPDGTLLWRGPRIRMGVHSGRPSTYPDPATMGIDFFGSEVQTTNLLGSYAHGGQIILSENVYNKAHEDTSMKELLSTVHIKSLEPVMVDSAKIGIYSMVPKKLGRRDFKPLPNPTKDCEQNVDPQDTYTNPMMVIPMLPPSQRTEGGCYNPRSTSIKYCMALDRIHQYVADFSVLKEKADGQDAIFAAVAESGSKYKALSEEYEMKIHDLNYELSQVTDNLQECQENIKKLEKEDNSALLAQRNAAESKVIVLEQEVDYLTALRSMRFRLLEDLSRSPENKASPVSSPRMAGKLTPISLLSMLPGIFHTTRSMKNKNFQRQELDSWIDNLFKDIFSNPKSVFEEDQVVVPPLRDGSCAAKRMEAHLKGTEQEELASDIAHSLGFAVNRFKDTEYKFAIFYRCLCAQLPDALFATVTKLTKDLKAHLQQVCGGKKFRNPNGEGFLVPLETLKKFISDFLHEFLSPESEACIDCLVTSKARGDSTDEKVVAEEDLFVRKSRFFEEVRRLVVLEYDSLVSKIAHELQTAANRANVDYVSLRQCINIIANIDPAWTEQEVEQIIAESAAHATFISKDEAMKQGPYGRFFPGGWTARIQPAEIALGMRKFVYLRHRTFPPTPGIPLKFVPSLDTTKTKKKAPTP